MARRRREMGHGGAVACLVAALGCGDAGDGAGAEVSVGTGASTMAVTATATEDPSTASGSGGPTPMSASDSADGSSGDPSSESDTGPGGGCEGVSLRDIPADTAMRGPWTVGARTVDVAGLDVEVWYPAAPGAEDGAEQVVYDIREAIPASERRKISDEDNPWQPCDCFRDLEVDADHGPYPVIVFVHGTASFRSQSLPQMVHWASRGFIVVAADHPGLWLADLLGSVCGAGTVAQDLEGNVQSILEAVRGETDELAFLGDRIDTGRIGMSGHSAGGGAIEGFGDDAQVLVPLAAGGTQAGAALVSTLVLGGTADTIVAYSQTQGGFTASPSPKRLVGIENAGHLTFSQICSMTNAAGANLLEIATDAGVCGAQFAGFLFQCSDELIADTRGWEIIDDVTAAAFEETLHCSAAGERFDGLQARYPEVSELLQR